VGVNHPTDLGIPLVEDQMGRSIGRGAKIALDDTAVLERNHDQMLRP
jgi:hypothetical protein